MFSYYKTKAGKRMLMLKLIICVCLITNHFYPGHIGLISNLLWLFAF